jgi:aerobic-type carbon monoxide dehydrogenase small subunit (CoxS/CutS family)
MAISLTVNGEARQFEAEADTPLLWVLREDAALTGTKFGCGIGMCGACTVHVDGQAVRSCIMPISLMAGKDVVTIEGLADPAQGLHPVQQAWAQQQVPQCGYCQPGMIMAAAALLKDIPDPSDEQIAASITNICRCGTYPRITAAIRAAIDLAG